MPQSKGPKLAGEDLELLVSLKAKGSKASLPWDDQPTELDIILKRTGLGIVPNNTLVRARLQSGLNTQVPFWPSQETGVVLEAEG